MDVTKSSTAAFINMDYTLYKKYLWKAIFANHKQNRFNRIALYGFIAYQYPLWILTRMGLLSKGYFFHQNAAKLAWLMKLVFIERVERVWEWLIDNEIITNPIFIQIPLWIFRSWRYLVIPSRYIRIWN